MPVTITGILPVYDTDQRLATAIESVFRHTNPLLKLIRGVPKR